jgi:UDP-N-acetylmuramyl pentapeptide phosphotransferase/UDP-N-acetylglucosamine-1-phosphate transferase
MSVAALSIIWSMNAYNFMDGANGMAGFMAFIGFGAMAIAGVVSGAYQLAVICAAVSGTAIGFLPLNYPTARVFMGDSGSILLGFLASTLGWYGWVIGAWALHFPLLVFSPFLVDATVTMLRRTFRGEKIWLPHRQHFYQRLIIDCHWSHGRTVLVYALIMVLVSLDALRLHSGRLLSDPSAQWATPLPALLTWMLIYGVILVVAESYFGGNIEQKK